MELHLNENVLRVKTWGTICLLMLAICGDVYLTLEKMCPYQKLYKSKPDTRNTTKVDRLNCYKAKYGLLDISCKAHRAVNSQCLLIILLMTQKYLRYVFIY